MQRAGLRPASRLVFVNRYFWPDSSATARILAAVAFDLAEQGHEIFVVAGDVSHDGLSRYPARERRRGVEIHRICSPVSGGRGLARRGIDGVLFARRAAAAVPELVRSGDVVIVKTDPPLLSVWLADPIRRGGARLVNWIQDLYPETAAALGVRFARGLPGRMLARRRDRALLAAETNIAIGGIMASHLRRLGVAPSRVMTVPNFADDGRIAPIPATESALRSACGFGPGAMVVGYSGTLGRAHEFETMLDAAARIADRPDIRFLFVGGGHGRPALERRVKALGLKGFVFRPFQPSSRLGDTLAAADIHWLSLRPELEGCVVPSKVYGIAAAGRGAIMVGHPNGEVALLLRRHRWGVTVAPGDGEVLARSLLELADDPGRRHEWGRAARSFVDNCAGRQVVLWMWRAMAQAWTSTPPAEPPAQDPEAQSAPPRQAAGGGTGP